MPTVAIIGASRGIGLELARQYAADGWRVHATTRRPESPGALGEVPGDVVLHGLDVRDEAAVGALARALGDDALDVLVHNAGIKDGGHSRAEVMRVNAEAPIAVTEALMDAVARAGGRIVLVSSQLGARRGSRKSLGDYGDSKAALNDAVRERAPRWAERGVTAIVIHPGWVRTDMGGSAAPVSVDESAHGIRSVISRLTPADNGRFLTWRGDEHPW
ncbi:MAG: SDR family NAD(P)-dependent oxidoreductase [Ectothiorhodospiraceae bacterium]|nr:SDR family NAD(P)-dependent oxidoreductase [Chromatiales bacterium]MCP5154293.1 SDR family NAD(P)-dependent oxidoreductase [Ectothiorhodospiraceae bacterium]